MSKLKYSVNWHVVGVLGFLVLFWGLVIYFLVPVSKAWQLLKAVLE